MFGLPEYQSCIALGQYSPDLCWSRQASVPALHPAQVLEVAAVLSWGGEPFLLPEGKAEASSICVSSDLDHVGKLPKS